MVRHSSTYVFGVTKHTLQLNFSRAALADSQILRNSLE